MILSVTLPDGRHAAIMVGEAVVTDEPMLASMVQRLLERARSTGQDLTQPGQPMGHGTGTGRYFVPTGEPDRYDHPAIEGAGPQPHYDAMMICGSCGQPRRDHMLISSMDFTGGECPETEEEPA